MNVLITSASRKVSLVKSFQEALSEVTNGAGKLVVVDSKPLSASLYFSDNSHVVPKSEAPGFNDAIVEICKAENVTLIIPTRDEDLPHFATYSDYYAKLGITTLVPDLDVVDACQDKYKFVQFCISNGFKVAEVVDTPFAEGQKYPVFVRARKSKSSRFAAKADSPEALRHLLEQFGEDSVIQEYIDVPEFTIDLFSDLDGNVLSVVPRRRLSVFGGESFIGQTFYNEILIQESARLAASMGLIGHNAFQCFFDGENVLFIEVNPRYGGGSSLSFAAGANSPLMLLQLLQGQTVTPIIGEFERDLVMIRYTQDVFVRKGDVIK